MIIVVCDSASYDINFCVSWLRIMHWLTVLYRIFIYSKKWRMHSETEVSVFIEWKFYLSEPNLEVNLINLYFLSTRVKSLNSQKTYFDRRPQYSHLLYWVPPRLIFRSSCVGHCLGTFRSYEVLTYIFSSNVSSSVSPFLLLPCSPILTIYGDSLVFSVSYVSQGT